MAGTRSVRRKVPRQAMPKQVDPMLARLADPPEDPKDWAIEVKWDGVRALAYVDNGELRLTTRNHNDITAQFPELHVLPGMLAHRQVILDAEIVVLDRLGRSSFQQLQPRMGVSRADTIAQRALATPAVLMVFDVLWTDQGSVMELPFDERRAVLESLDLPTDRGPVRVSPLQRGALTTILDRTRKRGLEGVIAKRRDAPYRPGSRTGEWLKLKHVRRQEFVIGGWTPGTGSRAGRIGALLVGYYQPGEDGQPELVYAGSVGSGFNRAALDRLQTELDPRARQDSPFDVRSPGNSKPVGKWQAITGRTDLEQSVNYVEPELVCEVAYAEFTRDGTLRHPSFKGLRFDKRPDQVILEPQEGVV
jgi:bifunctional non-homologous end joining protein LigD